MGVYIDMKMPIDCPMCPMAHYNKLDEFTGCEIVPGKKYEMMRPEYANSDCRPDWCPLVEVPTPHGDLIERDKLREKEFIHDGDAYAVVMSRDIRNAPTIIPAEESEQ